MHGGSEELMDDSCRVHLQLQLNLACFPSVLGDIMCQTTATVFLSFSCCTESELFTE